jgi:hypothetical protein
MPKRACCVLTAKGREIAPDFCTEVARAANATTRQPIEAHRSGTESPRRNGEACQLWSAKLLIKEFRPPAVNQELVLAAFEEEGWPSRIDDPLPSTSNIDPRGRLHDTIKALNRHHLHQILRICGDGKGRGSSGFGEERSSRSSPDRPQIVP